MVCFLFLKHLQYHRTFDIPLLPLWSLLVHIEQQICWPWLYNQRLKHWSSACKAIHPSFIQFRLLGARASLNRAVTSNPIINQLSEKVCRFRKSVQRNDCLFLRLKLSVSATSRVSSNRKQHHAISLMNPLHLTSDLCCNWKLEKLSGSNMVLCMFLACSQQAVAVSLSCSLFIFLFIYLSCCLCVLGVFTKCCQSIC